mmetsp:Transcript_34174/g.89902  ORF Transcript_34174/g.89902 Transcript_34174/m.89902 type:complete len:226 (-) Transcript_34174:716-1393(-)
MMTSEKRAGGVIGIASWKMASRMNVMIGEQLRMIMTKPREALARAMLDVARLSPHTSETTVHLPRSSHVPNLCHCQKESITTVPIAICSTVAVTETLNFLTTHLLASDMAIEHVMQKTHESAMIVARETSFPCSRSTRLNGSKTGKEPLAEALSCLRSSRERSPPCLCCFSMKYHVSSRAKSVACTMRIASERCAASSASPSSPPPFCRCFERRSCSKRRVRQRT